MNELPDRLREVMRELNLSKPTDLAEFCGVSEGLVSQWFSGTTKLGPKPLKAFARTQFSLDWITEGKLPKYRLRVVDAGSESNIGPGPDIRGQVPLISWVAAGSFCESPDNFAPGDAEKWLSCPVPHGKYTYCLRVVGKSMDNGDDGYRDGEIIFVDPDVEAMPGRDAIVRTPNGESTFKRLKQDVDGLYLQALNPRWEPNYFKLPEGSHICGIVIFAGRER